MMAGFIALAFIAWAIGLWVLFAWAAGTIAKTKGRSFGNWAWIAVAYGVFAVLAVYLMPALEPKQIPAATKSTPGLPRPPARQAR